MKSLVRIKPNLPAIIAHLSKEEGRRVGQDEAIRWLKEAGFKPSGSYWVVSEADLGHLQPSEVLEIESVDAGE